MSDISSRKLIGKRRAPLLLLTAVGAVLFAGCGGGGGNGNSGGFGNTGTNSGTNSGTNTGTSTGTNSGSNNGGSTANASIIGKVVDTQGNGVPGVTINTDSGGVLATTLVQGGYRLNNISGNVVHTITAAVTRQDNVTYSGSTQVYAIGDALVSNANIILSRTDQQATVSGMVLDSSNNPVQGARVYLSVPNNAFTSNGSYSSLVAYTGSTGQYTIANIPTNLPTGNITITASTTGAQNESFTLTGLQAGGFGHQDFQLSGATGQSLNAPSISVITAFTEPTDAISASIRRSRAAQSSVYEHLRCLLTPAYARLVAGHRGLGKRLQARASGQYAIEMNIVFSDANQPVGSSVLNYNIYRTTGSGNATQITENQSIYDQLFDPLATYYTDLTFSGDAVSPYVAYTQYNFALSAVSTDNPTASNNTESGLSPVFSVTPLGTLTLNQPTPGQVMANNVTLTWNPVSGATKYFVFIYDQYPTAEVQPIYYSPTARGQEIAAGATSYTLSGPLRSGNSYYALVAGAADPTENTNAQTGQPTVVYNGVVSFSQITRFYVQ